MDTARRLAKESEEKQKKLRKPVEDKEDLGILSIENLVIGRLPMGDKEINMRVPAGSSDTVDIVTLYNQNLTSLEAW